MTRWSQKALPIALFALSVSSLSDEMVEEELLGLYGSEEFISIATGYKQPITKAPAVASIIDSKQIENMGAIELEDILEQVPGLHISRNSQGYNPIFTFRGIYSDFNPQVLVMLDGVPLSNLFTGNRSNAWGSIPAYMIDRIEVIRGPGSAIYGADAFSGVIHVITKSSDSYQGFQGAVRYGSLDTKSVYMNYGKQWGDHSVGFGFNYVKTDGNSEAIKSDAQSFLDFVTGTNASLAPGSLSLQRETIDIKFDYKRKNFTVYSQYQDARDGGLGVGIVEALDDNGRYRSTRWLTRLNYQEIELAEDVTGRLEASYLRIGQIVDEDIFLYPPGSTGPFLDQSGAPIFGVFENGVVGNPEVFEDHARVDGAINFSLLDNHNFTVGVGYYYGDMYETKEDKNFCFDNASCAYLFSQGSTIGGEPVDVSDTPFVFLGEDSRENYHVYIQDVYRFANDWELTAGVRYDNYSDFGDTVNPRLALVWSTTRKLTTKFLYGEAFRAPSFSETRNINNPAALGNPDLDPETLKSFELVFDYKPIKGLEYIVNTFYYEWSDIIQFVPDPVSGVNVAQNAGRQTGYGVEAELHWSPVNELELAGNFSIQQSTNENTNEDAANSPQKQLYLQANWMLADNWNLNVQGNWVMDRKREASDIRSPVDDYATVDFSLSRKNLFQGLELALHVKNLFDEDAREPSQNGVPVALIPNDLPLPGRRVIGELRYRF